ncbi:hypothetical protein D5R81_12870 [Parashewanella spongiae]|uniref:Cupin n=1 Tax=Parashewanella spongiae TaxID=342950 RepID=A0A3A6TAF7_9GAMM|nr:hypothetical protein [Parashewanella spongiae]MCL1078853.1 cupin [Parashewanella spongiae]RJY11829.1 hypothetical protein D5R81_12870 [Parashewanella spongiae]
MNNLFKDIPTDLSKEVIQVLAETPQTRIERIVSFGQKSSENFWYDQDENEWVVVIKGRAQIDFVDGRKCILGQGDFLNLKTSVDCVLKHRKMADSKA